jgi:lipopolysaccharide transport system permease protein
MTSPAIGRQVDPQEAEPGAEPETIVFISSRDTFADGLAEFIAQRELLSFLVWRDIKVRYKQTVLGVVWALLVPLFQAFIFTLIFGRFAKIDTDGPYPYSVFVLAGLIPWTFFSQAVTQGSQSLVNQQHLLTKVYFPRLFVPSSAVLGCLIDFGIGLLMYAVVLAYYRIAPSASIVFILPLSLLITLAALGLVYFLSALTVSYRDFRYVVPIAIQVLMYASPIIYPVNIFPARYKWIVALNPIVGIIDGYRSAILGKPWDLHVLGTSILSTFICLFVGLWYFRRTERRFADIA